MRFKMTVAYEFSQRSSYNGATSAICLEDRFEVIKDIGDGSFGSVVLARVRTAGANIARRGSVVSIPDPTTMICAYLLLGRHQNHEKDFRLFRALPGTSRSHLSADTPCARSPCASARRLP